MPNDRQNPLPAVHRTAHAGGGAGAPRTDQAAASGTAGKVAATCIVLSFLLAVVLVTDPLIPREGYTAVDLARRQALAVWVYGGSLAVLQAVAGIALILWFRTSSSGPRNP